MDTELVVRDEERLPYDGREEWVEPVLTRHQTLVALTLAPAPVSPEVMDLAIAASVVMMQIGGSQGVFCGPSGCDPTAPPGSPGSPEWGP